MVNRQGDHYLHWSMIMRTRFFTLLAALTIFILAALPASAADSSIALASAGKISNKGQVATISVTMVCPVGVSTYAGGSVVQITGRTVASGYGYSEYFTCTGEPQTVSIPVTTQGSPFMGGPATASGYAYWYQYDEYGNYIGEGEVSTSGAIRLRK
jgi:hypothetical protein